MDASSLKNQERSRNRNNMEDFNGEGRSLNELPENILSHIISFLPTKDAVRTSILSKKWVYMWTSIPNLCFEDGNRCLEDFVNIVDNSLLRRGSFDITSFSLHCNSEKYFLNSKGFFDIMSCIKAWIYHIVGFNVQDVKLSLLGHSDLTLPFRFANCRTLTSLTIIAPSVSLTLPSTVCFSNLRKLELCVGEFLDKHSAQKLFSGCPVLEDVILKACDWNGLKAVSVVSSRLQRFTMIEDEKSSIRNFESDEFGISCGGLKYFHYEGQFRFKFNISNSQLLEEAHIGTYLLLGFPPPFTDNFSNLLTRSSNVRILRFMNALIFLDIISVRSSMPTFHDTLRPELDYESSNLSSNGLLELLGNTPSLESLVFLEGIKMPFNKWSVVPSCFTKSLKSIVILIKKGGLNNLMEGVKCLLENATFLKKIEIEFSKHVNESTINNFCIELLKFPRGSRFCGIYVRKSLQ